jgi:hypothetical protein
MSDGKPSVDLERALQLSHALVGAADQGQFEALAELDAQRLQLLKSFRLGNRQIDAADRAILQEISELNDRALGHMEHHRRIKGRQFDMAAVGRRAVTAYATTRLQR